MGSCKPGYGREELCGSELWVRIGAGGFWMERLFLREKTEEPVFSVPQRVKIGVVGAARGAGASFAAGAVAKVLSLDKKRRVSLAEILLSAAAEKPRPERENEMPGKTRKEKTASSSGRFIGHKPLLYDSLGMDRRFAGRDFVRFYKLIKDGCDIRGLTNVDERINWVLPTPEDTDGGLLTETDALRLVNNIPGDIVVCDLPSGTAGALASDADILICVIDPLPSRLLAAEEYIEEIKKLEAAGKRLIWLVNKYNSGINKRELAAFLRLRETAQFPLIPGEILCNAEYTCRLPCSIREVNELLRGEVEKIILRHKIFT